MSKRPYNDIEQIIKQVAEANEPTFDEQAWEKMEALLDKEKGREKTFLWLWWLLPIVLGVSFLGYYQYNKVNKEEATVPITISAVQKSKPDLPNVEILQNNPERNPENISRDIPSISQERHPLKNTFNNNVGNPKINTIYKNSLSETSGNESFIERRRKNISENVKAKSALSVTAAQPEEEEKKSNVIEEHQDLDKNKVVENLKEKLPAEELNNPDNINEKTTQIIGTSDTTSIKKMKKAQQRSSKFYFIAAAGEEMNGVKLFSSGEISSRLGFTAGYQVFKNLSIQTGFFVSSKKYVAGPNDYKPKAGSYWSIVDITKIDASCRVYEVPITVRYDFNKSKKINFFSSAGLSSFFMKKEDYHYYYIRYGTPRNAIASYSGNQHLFSVLRIGAGAEQKISSQFALNISPGFSLPLAGVGEGKVKLYSTDLVVGLKFTPKTKK